MNLEAEFAFRDRRDAGAKLARALPQAEFGSEPIVLALPRGGVPVGFEIAIWLQTDLDVFLVRKLGLPGQEELAIGAIASGGVRVLNEPLVRTLRLAPALINTIAQYEREELDRREQLYRQGRPPVPVRGRNLVLVDDGLATGTSMRAALIALRSQDPQRIVVAVPVGAPQTCEELKREADAVVCLRTPDAFVAVGSWYENFPQLSDAEVRSLLVEAKTRVAFRGF